MDSQDYCAYLGNTYGRRPLRSIAIKEWDCVFDGTKAQVIQFIKENPPTPPLQYVIAPSNYEVSETVIRPIVHMDRVKTIQKVTVSGIHTCIHSFHHNIWHFNIEMTNGNEGLITHNDSELLCKEGDNVLYTMRKVKGNVIIQVKTIFG